VDAEQSLGRGILGRPLTAEGAAWCVWGLSLALAVVGAVLWFLNRDLGGAVFVLHLLLVPGLASVGVVVAVRRRGHRIGWLFRGMGLVAALTGFSFEYAVRAGVTAPGSLPAGWLLAIAAWTWPLSFAGVGFLLLLFPDVRLPRLAGDLLHGRWPSVLPISQPEPATSAPEPLRAHHRHGPHRRAPGRRLPARQRHHP
jgi:hypothetical protein